MSLIHPSAQISPKAQIGKNVRIGMGAIVEEGCVIGDETEIRPHAIISGGAQIGTHNQIGFGAIIGAEPQDLAFKNVPSKAVIGDHNIIREYVTIHRGTKENTETKVGSHCYIMTGAHLAHNCLVGDRVIIVNNVLLAGYVEVQDGAFLGGGSAVHQFVRIGAHSIMRGQTRIGRDLPPFFMAVDTNQVSGINRVGLKRSGFTPDKRRNIQSAYKLLYRSGKNVSQALDLIADTLKGDEIDLLVNFIRSTKRGICMESRALDPEVDI
ncbi:MAG: acyl-ACP--UDP-N-acetylglucosamine O-acyltransferase [Verrucomicrobiota bacterium]